MTAFEFLLRLSGFGAPMRSGQPAAGLVLESAAIFPLSAKSTVIPRKARVWRLK
jgi:hypothetical protein